MLSQTRERTETFEGRLREGFCEGVGKIVGAGNTSNIDGAIVDAFSDVVIMHINVFAL